MNYFLSLLIFFNSGILLIAAEKDNAVKLKKAAFRMEKFKENREPMTPTRSATEYTGRVAFEIGIEIYDTIYWNNELHTEAVEATVKTVGWEFEYGTHLGKYVDLFWHHHSRHTMDEEQPSYYNPRDETVTQNKFPVEDSFGIRFDFLGKDTHD